MLDGVLVRMNRPPSRKANLHVSEFTKPDDIGELDRLVAARVLERVPKKDVILSCPAYVLRRKTPLGTKLRLVFNAREVNSYITESAHVELHGIRHCMLALPTGSFTTSLDLSDAFLHIPIRGTIRELCTFLARRPDGSVDAYRWNTLPFGVSVAPRWCQTIYRALLNTFAWPTTCSFLLYLDDILIFGPDPVQLRRVTLAVVEYLAKFGILVKMSKSRLVPKQKFEHLGMILDTVGRTTSVHRERWHQERSWTERWLHVLDRFPHKTKWIFKHLRQHAGKLAWLASAAPTLKFYMRRLQLLEPRADDPEVVRAALLDLRRGLTLCPRYKHWIPVTENAVHLFTDACPTGWGAWSPMTRIATGHGWRYTPQWSAHGHWERGAHVTELETRAAAHALRIYCDDYLPDDVNEGCIVVHSDATAAVAAARGTGHSVACLDTIRDIILRLARRDWKVVAEHIPGVENTLADTLSRLPRDSGDYMLHPDFRDELWQAARQHLGATPTIDLMAAHHNRQCDDFFSEAAQPGARGHNVYLADWSRIGGTAYVNPPWRQLDVLTHHLERRRRGFSLLMVTPDWKHATWYRRLLLAPGLVSTATYPPRVFFTRDDVADGPPYGLIDMPPPRWSVTAWFFESS